MSEYNDDNGDDNILSAKRIFSHPLEKQSRGKLFHRITRKFLSHIPIISDGDAYAAKSEKAVKKIVLAKANSSRYKSIEKTNFGGVNQ